MAKSNTDFIVGIDLGTTNIVVAYAPASGDGKLEILPIPQLTAAGQVEALPSLAAVRYHFGPEVAARDTRLPWTASSLAKHLPAAIIGAWAAQLGQRNPNRLVHSAKSWLSCCQQQLPQLPAAQPGQGKPREQVASVTPVEATASYLDYLVQTWRYAFPDQPLAKQQVYVTIPASFDDHARTLTLEAAKLAGLSRVRLLEEPLAACYDWLRRHPDAGPLAHSRRLLVCDIGGGTSDFTLVDVTPGREIGLERVAVGEHLMLGGDNMDLALAARAQRKLLEEQQRKLAETQPQGQPQPASRLNPLQLYALQQQARFAKEALLAEQAPEEMGLTLLGSGSSLIGGAHRTRLTQKEVRQLVLDGFFPLVKLGDRPRRRQGALQALGLPYPADAAISRHLAAFLTSFSQPFNGSDNTAKSGLPDALLLNGSPFFSPLLCKRLAQQLELWCGQPVTHLAHPDPGHAVALGAAHFGWRKASRQRLIESGCARNYFILADSPAGKQAICILPKGSREGVELELSRPEFSLRCGQPVQFEVASSRTDQSLLPGTQQPLSESMDLLPKLVTEAAGQGDVPVHIQTRLSEIGLLEVVCQATDGSGRRWPLEFNLRRHEQAGDREQSLSGALQQAIDEIEVEFGSRDQHQPRAKAALRKRLEKLLGPRNNWSAVTARALADTLIERANRRRRSERHEQIWFNLTGFCLRPGFGVPGDNERIAALWPLYEAGLQYRNKIQSLREWWIFWRRLAAGLSEEQQLTLLDDAGMALVPARSKSELEQQAQEEQFRLIGSLERVPLEIKTELGEMVLASIEQTTTPAAQAWALARIGARKLAYGAVDYRVAPQQARKWLQQLLALGWQNTPELAFCAVSLARPQPDEPPLDVTLYQELLTRLQQAKQTRWRDWLEAGGQQGGEQLQTAVWGEALPQGLVLEGG